MTFPIQSTALFSYLKKTERPEGLYSGKVLEVREILTRWLEYIPQTFPHFTQHTVEHSDEIVVQLSKMLFEEDDPDRPTIKLTAMEAYVLIVCAYLHDAGMVSSDREKQQILSSDSWKRWTSTSAADRWNKIQALRSGTAPPEEEIRHFIADMLTREMIAEFIRRMHHKRVVNVIRNQSAVGRFAFDDKQLEETIGVICVAHGLTSNELEDAFVYPRLRQLRGENVDVRLLAVLLRFGDLLDLRTNRACPILFSAADPLSPSSLPHWLQYQRIRHIAISPSVIEINAECQSIDEHRVLRDWCQWIVDEVRGARLLLAGTGSHRDWEPPRASIDTANATICITPAKGADYLVRDWRFELDPASIFQRLIGDLYDDPFTFLRELIQNALDSMRCRLYEDLRLQGAGIPEKPTRVSDDIRQRYLLRIESKETKFRNEMTGEEEMITAIVVDDCGIGMNEDVIKRHFLQVGRSYYDTEDFRRNYLFVPASRFGVGFLSVFGASDDVIVDSLRYPSQQAESIRLRLTGPRNYLAVSKSERKTNGTRIEVRLRPGLSLAKGKLTEMVRSWCRKVEFPVEVSDFGHQATISREQPGDFLFEVGDAETIGASFALKVFPIRGHELEGELYVLAHRSKDGIENWTKTSWYKYNYRTLYPGAEIRPLPETLRCFHGIALGEVAYSRDNAIARIDFRGRRSRPDLSRRDVVTMPGSGEDSEEELASHWKQIIGQHLGDREKAQGTISWKYRNLLADDFDLPGFWEEFDGMIPLLVKGREQRLSLTALAAFPILTELIPASGKYKYCFQSPGIFREEAEPIEVVDSPLFVDLPAAIRESDFSYISESLRPKLLKGRTPVNCRWLDAATFAIDWKLSGRKSIADKYNNRVIFACELSSKERIAIYIDHTYPMQDVLLVNPLSPFGQWYIRLVDSVGLTDPVRALNAVLSEVAASCFLYGKGEEPKTFKRHLAGWAAMKDLPKDLIPPDVDIGVETFHWHYGAT